MISHAPVVIGGQLYVQSESGTLQAFAVPVPKPTQQRADDAAEVSSDETS
jgi:hypothetical protein